MMNQKEATYAAICNVTGHKGEGVCEITKEQRAQVNMILVDGFKNKKIALDKDYGTEAELKSYVSGLISNWLRKDKRLNGGVQYTAKNPGSRAGSGDPMLKSLKALLQTVPDSEKAEIQGYIDARQQELGAAKVTATVDFSALPPELRSKYQTEQ